MRKHILIGKTIVTKDANWVYCKGLPPNVPVPAEFLPKGESVVIVWEDGHASCPFIVGKATNGKMYGSYYVIPKLHVATSDALK